MGLKERIGMLDDKAVAYLSSVALAKEDDDAPDRSSCLNLLWRWEKLLHQPFLVGLEGVELLGFGDN